MISGDNKNVAFLRGMFDLAISSVAASKTLPAYLPELPTGRCLVLAVGKGAAAMAAEAKQRYGEAATGIVVTRYGHLAGYETSLVGYRCFEAGHPYPDDNGVQAACHVANEVAKLGKDDLLLALVSGGASALLPWPLEGVSLHVKTDLTKQLLSSGATIGEINCVRKQLSVLKGGRVAALAAPARVVTLLVSDVVDDDPSLIASGPTVQDFSTQAQAKAIMETYGIEVPECVRIALDNPANSTPDLEVQANHRNRVEVVASAAFALAAVEKAASSAGLYVINLGGRIEGEAREVAAEHAQLVGKCVHKGRPTLVISGGELTVSLINAPGRGGANTEYALALAIALDGKSDVWALACDSDGTDGVGGAAGAWIGPETLAYGVCKSKDPIAYLAANDSAGYFAGVGGLVRTGPTGTNINDLRFILINA